MTVQFVDYLKRLHAHSAYTKFYFEIEQFSIFASSLLAITYTMTVINIRTLNIYTAVVL